MYSPTAIDLSALTPPEVIETLSYESLNSGFMQRFAVTWEALRAQYPDLPSYDVQVLQTDPVAIVSQAWAAIRLMDRQRVNDAAKALLASLAEKGDLENIAARVNVRRLVVVPATATSSAVMEIDDRLRRRYLLAFDKPAAGSVARYIYEALTAVPTLLDAAVVGRVVHGRPGETEVVLLGPGGRVPTNAELDAVRSACTADNVKPEATKVTVLPARRATYTVSLRLELPAGPSPGTVVSAAVAAVTAVAAKRMVIGGEVPPDSLKGAAYVDPVLNVVPVALPGYIAADPYTAPVMTGINITTTVRTP